MAAALAATGVCGCAGYQIGNGTLYHPEIRTVRVPVFESASFRRNLGEQLTEAVVKRIETDTNYKVVHHAGADSILTGRIVADSKRVVAENINDEPRDIELAYRVHVNWVNHRGDVIRDSTSFPLPSVLADVSQSTNLVSEAGQSVASSQQKAVDRLAEQIVSLLEQPW